ncbi:hypothetical protein [Pseudofrankia sp. BMG5.36]|uniref:hypothetical protein n=1 Tax=Pseudofrankia sp. BMG5.36 TaxID=1834512 RepID=UPI0008D9E747|nr:hypothetical protein [Pseudofrankia sp. BMG5.36]OHV55380.1 hypothetical protein BCD48_08885 [Pseudofrankia sp. BMG5.36]
MSDHDMDVLDVLKDSLDDITMDTPVEQIEAAGRVRRRRRRIVGMTAGVAAAAGLALGVPMYGSPSTAPPTAGDSTGAGAVHIRTVAYTVDTVSDGTVHVTWDKEMYIKDHAGLEAALRQAGFPVLIKEGEFCKGPQDDGTLDPSGSGPGVRDVMKGERGDDGRVTFVFTPSAMPAGTQLFIGYLNEAQLAATNGNPGSVERLVPTGVPLTCTTDAPPAHVVRGGSEGDGARK